MTWLSYGLDEVAHFHPAFDEIAQEALVHQGLDKTFHWVHHPKSSGVGVVPDFVLLERSTGRWVVVVEIKRRRDAVTSERNQIQAKGYAEANASLFRIGRPKYFVVTNLEFTQLYALRDGLPPKDCLVEGMSFVSGTFAQTGEEMHRMQLKQHIASIIQYCKDQQTPTFATVWPQIVRTAYAHALELPYLEEMDVLADHVPVVVRDYFSVDSKATVRREVVLRCLLVEYVRGILRRHNHPKRNTVSSPGTTVSGVANSLVQIRAVDFAGVFEDGAASTYLGFESNAQVKAAVELYLTALQSDNVSNLAEVRGDGQALPFELIKEAIPPSDRDARGKAATDAELATLLAGMAITHPSQIVLDPGSGEGNLLSAAYDRLKDFGLEHAEILANLRGIEADTLAAKIAALRMALKEPYAIQLSDPCHIVGGDLYNSAATLNSVDVILMNPPFKRYEAQDTAPVPAALRDYYRDSIVALSSQVETDQGQSNLYVYYVEYVIKAAKDGATIAIILDNKWYHNEVTRSLREFLLARCKVIAVVTYPHSRYFEGIMIATSMLVIQKCETTSPNSITFARVEDPAGVSAELAAAIIRGAEPASGWSVRRVSQDELTANSWKTFMSQELFHEFRRAPLVPLPSLFTFGRRGSLAKEGGGIAVYEFPFRNQYGPRRHRLEGGSPFQTLAGETLNPNQNATLRSAALAVPDTFRGYAINKADRISGYELVTSDVTRDWTIEMPEQRQGTLSNVYHASRRASWSESLDDLVDSIRLAPGLGEYIVRIEQYVGLDETVLPRQQLWNVLREPYAGELIVPRKQRVGHRVHVNPFAFDKSGRQVRLSSNFLSYSGCICEDLDAGLTAVMATRLIAAWLMSSFGHLQFEMLANNREGARSLEQHHVDQIFVFDPRLIRPEARSSILECFAALPFPVRTDLRVELQPELISLDKLFAAEMAHILDGFEENDALADVWSRLYELHEMRNK
ncbi:MAG: BpuSI family type II restriction endonuclease [Agrobacterium tumefaciens]|nr:BpuSI family type II restriction endonuclease [Agrobacterium tumefaciens]